MIFIRLVASISIFSLLLNKKKAPERITFHKNHPLFYIKQNIFVKKVLYVTYFH